MLSLLSTIGTVVVNDNYFLSFTAARVNDVDFYSLENNGGMWITHIIDWSEFVTPVA